MCVDDDFGQDGVAPYRRIDKVVNGAKSVIEVLDAQHDRIGLMTFNNVVQQTDKLVPADAAFNRVLSNLPDPSNGTALYDCILKAIDLFKSTRTRSRKKAQLELVVLTDGADTRSKASLDDVCAALAKPGLSNFHLILMVVGVDHAQTQQVLKQLCKPRHCVYVPVEKSQDAIRKAFHRHVVQRYLQVRLPNHR